MLNIPKSTIQDAYEMGRDCAKNGPNLDNCHFSLFASKEHTEAWGQGKREAEQEKEPTNAWGLGNRI